MYIYVRICTHMYIYVHTRTYMYIFVHRCTYIYTYLKHVCTCIHTHACRSIAYAHACQTTFLNVITHVDDLRQPRISEPWTRMIGVGEEKWRRAGTRNLDIHSNKVMNLVIALQDNSTQHFCSGFCSETHIRSHRSYWRSPGPFDCEMRVIDEREEAHHIWFCTRFLRSS